jgi:hypothetical protein
MLTVGTIGLAALALLDAQHHAFEINVGYLQ